MSQFRRGGVSFKCVFLFMAAGIISWSIVSSARSHRNVAAALMRRYHDTSTMICRGGLLSPMPAFYCSGILIRGVSTTQRLRYPWSMKPLNKKKGSFGIGFLRKDAEFRRFPSGYTSGFILKPDLKKSNGKRYKAYCAFPIDGSTDMRRGSHACGEHKRDNHKPKTSGLCSKQGIFTLNQWKHHYDKITDKREYFVQRQCAFDMTGSGWAAANNFETVLQAKRYLMKHGGRGTTDSGKHREYGSMVTEVRLESWDERDEKSIPIEAFFYFLHDKHAFRTAKKYQADFKKASGKRRPIVGIQLPDGKGKHFKVKLHDS